MFSRWSFLCIAKQLKDAASCCRHEILRARDLKVVCEHWNFSIFECQTGIKLARNRGKRATNNWKNGASFGTMWQLKL